MNFDQVIIELYRLAETKNWNGKITDDALSAAVEGMELLWEQKRTEKKRSALIQARKITRIWC